jgi:hypothetical protein
VFKAFEIVIKADYQVYYFIEIFRVGHYRHCALDPRFQAVEESRHSGSVIPGNPETVLIEFSQILWYRSRLHEYLEFLFRRPYLV